MYERISGPRAPYNLRFVTNGVACTTVSLIARFEPGGLLEMWERLRAKRGSRAA